MQLLHPVATVIAKSKLLVLPAYPAAWPQAKRHPLVQGVLQFCRRFTNLGVVQKTGHRYRQAEYAAAAVADGLGSAASSVGLGKAFAVSLPALRRAAAWSRRAARTVMTRTVEGLSALPVIGPLVGSYAAHFERAEQQDAEKLSASVRGLFERWSIKFSRSIMKPVNRMPRRASPCPDPSRPAFGSSGAAPCQ
jgi:hypothetical protein